MATPRKKGAAVLSAESVTGIRRALLDFYGAHARTLPWRDVEDPYRVLVSEVMLQQTRVDAVIPYYERWLARFPTIAALADAAVDDVLHAWQGLGYYSRARNLHRAAQLVRDRHAGVLPQDTALLRALPGIGDYTAGAIASIAYGRAAPAVDGNARRVLARLLDDAAPSAAGLRAAAATLVPAERPGDFNQALMELGATVCTPRRPRCSTCPLQRFCAARRAGTQRERPAPKTRTAAPTFTLGTAAVFDDVGRLLFVRRPDRGLLAGMWALPGTELRDGESAAAAAARAAADVLGTARTPTPLEAVGEFAHAFSHRREQYRVIAFRLDAPAKRRRGAARRAAVPALLEARRRRCRSDDSASHRFLAAEECATIALARASTKIAAACFAWLQARPNERLACEGSR